MKITYLIPAATMSTAMLLAGCASTPDPITALDKDTYMVVSRSMFYGLSAAAEGVKRADAFCKLRGKRMEMTNAETADATGAIPARSVVMFRCTD